MFTNSTTTFLKSVICLTVIIGKGCEPVETNSLFFYKVKSVALNRSQIKRLLNAWTQNMVNKHLKALLER